MIDLAAVIFKQTATAAIVVVAWALWIIGAVTVCRWVAG